MKGKRAHAKRGDAHVRLYGWELNSPAYRVLSCDARALLVEFRSLYVGRENRVYMSIREARARLGGAGQARVEKALRELVSIGWILLMERGAFHVKVRHATVYALTNEPLGERDGEVAPKDYMRWQSEKPQNAVLGPGTCGIRDKYRGTPEMAKKAGDATRNEYRPGERNPTSGLKTSAQIVLPRLLEEPAVLLWAAAQPGVGLFAQYFILITAFALAAENRRVKK